MAKRKLKIMFVFLVLMLSMLACEASFSTAKISEAYLTYNSDGSGRTSIFTNDQTFYCVVKVENAPEDTTLKAVWTALDVEGIEPNFLISEFELTTESESEFTFNLENDQLWPAGTYKVDIYLDGTLEETLEFSVE
jgi:hypothetical protein